MRQWLGILVTLLILLGNARAAAQTTQPAPATWGQAVQAIAVSIVNNELDKVITSIAADDLPVREFGISRNETRQRLTQRAEGMQCLVNRAYIWNATTIASDMASDLKACETIPPSLRNPFIPRDDTDAKKANSTAQHWVGSILEPAAGDLVAVLMFWEPPQATSTISLGNPPPEPKQPLFVFIKGKMKEDGDIKITLISFGDSKQALK